MNRENLGSENLKVELDELRSECVRLRKRTNVMFALMSLGVLLTIATGATFQAIGRFQGAVEVDDAARRIRAVLFADNGRNHSGLEIRDSQGRQKVGVHTNANDEPYLQMYDRNQKLRLEMGISPSGKSYIQILEPDGSAAWAMGSRN